MGLGAYESDIRPPPQIKTSWWRPCCYVTASSHQWRISYLYITTVLKYYWMGWLLITSGNSTGASTRHGSSCAPHFLLTFSHFLFTVPCCFGIGCTFFLLPVMCFNQTVQRHRFFAQLFGPGLCSTHESWVKFDSTLTQMSRVRVESAVKIQDMSRVRVESRWLSFESELSQLDTAWVKVESLIFRRENVKILQLSVTLQRKSQPTATFDRTPPPPPVNNFFPN